MELPTIYVTATVVALLTLGAAGCASSASESADEKNSVPAAAAPSTTVAKTTTTDPGPQEGDKASADELSEAVLEGSYTGKRTVLENNVVSDSYGPPGTVDERRYSFTTVCDGDGKCTATMVNHSAEDAETDFDLVDGKVTMREDEPSSCVNEDGSEFAIGSIAYRNAVEYRITEAEHRGGRWIATAFEGEGTFEGVVVDEAAWAVENCPWGTDDEKPLRERSSVTAELNH